jgi:hypothetical protein
MPHYNVNGAQSTGTAMKWQRREAKRHKARHGMRVTGRSVQTLLAKQSTGSIGLAAKRRQRGDRDVGKD